MKNVLGLVIPFAYLAVIYGYVHFVADYPTTKMMNTLRNMGYSWMGILVLGVVLLAMSSFLDKLSETWAIFLIGLFFVLYFA